MRTQTWISAFALSAVLGLVGCGGGEDATESGGTGGGVQSTDDHNAGEGSREEGRATLGSESAQQHGTVANDTTPHRPGVPSTP